MNKKLDKLVKRYVALENKIRAEIGNLPDYGEDCTCAKAQSIELIEYEGNTYDIESYGVVKKFCLKCGGVLKVN